ncbi:MAG: hypothetical protein KAJ72_01650, partial [Candidatus Heimdallarchaeota archaeon]|nr:hypothetical protein [Candidatus Heimdallarchaeota archaeon]
RVAPKNPPKPIINNNLIYVHRFLYVEVISKRGFDYVTTELITNYQLISNIIIKILFSFSE